MDEEKPEVGRGNVLLKLVCGGIVFVSDEADEEGQVGVRVDGDADGELDQLVGSNSEAIQNLTLGPCIVGAQSVRVCGSAGYSSRTVRYHGRGHACS